MKKFLVLLAIVLFLSACSSNSKKTISDEQIQNEIRNVENSGYKKPEDARIAAQRVVELNGKDLGYSEHQYINGDNPVVKVFIFNTKIDKKSAMSTAYIYKENGEYKVDFGRIHQTINNKEVKQWTDKGKYYEYNIELGPREDSEKLEQELKKDKMISSSTQDITIKLKRAK